MSKIIVGNKEEIRKIFKSWNSAEMKARLDAHPESIVCWTKGGENWGTPFAIYDNLKAASADLGSDAIYGVTPLRIWFIRGCLR